MREHYWRAGRRLPWRETGDPYAVLVSEFMLQQTQVERVLGHWGKFLERFPDPAALAAAPRRDVLGVWQGLGYNRRAVNLHETALRLVGEHGGRVPDDSSALARLPGIGPATAAAVVAFAFGRPVVFVETNIRAVFLHHFFHGREKVADAELLPLVARTLDRRDPRRWYWALMDYGVELKRRHPNPGRRSAHHRRQTRFEGSTRQLRGALVRLLLREGGLTALQAARLLREDRERVAAALQALHADGLVVLKGRRYTS